MAVVSEKVEEAMVRSRREGEGESDIPEGGGGGGSRGKPKRERGERSGLKERLRALRHRSHLPTRDKTAETSGSGAGDSARIYGFVRIPTLSLPRAQSSP